MFIKNTDKEIILKPLQVVIGIVERKQTLPILSNVLIEKENGKIPVQRVCLDRDGDGAGDPETTRTIMSCVVPAGEVTACVVDEGADCDDTSSVAARRFPGNLEICDRVDNDCSTTTAIAVDEDVDNDRYAPVGAMCLGPADGVATAFPSTDCDDADDAQNPGLPELCRTLVDEDCDTRVDEGFPTVEMACDGGDADLCTDGTFECSSDGMAVQCSDNAASIVEVCNGVNDDCDTMTDEPPATSSCSFPSVATYSCTGGMCVVATCVPNYLNCDDPRNTNGCEVNSRTDPLHCGTCTTACAFPDAVPTCAAGICTRGACLGGYADCTAAAACENTNTNVAHCGSCNNACPLLPNTTAPACTGGVCGYASCTANWGDCNTTSAAPGCETSLRTTTDCNGCGSGCAPDGAVPSCTTGACTYTACMPGYCDDNGSAGDGCENHIDRNPPCYDMGALSEGINVDGDSSDTSELFYTGSGEQWFRATVRESNLDAAGDPPCDDLGARFRITNTGPAVYRMRIRCRRCPGVC